MDPPLYDQREPELDCRTPTGVTVGLVDALITIARVLAPRLTTDLAQETREALLDLAQDEDLIKVLRWAEAAKRPSPPARPSWSGSALKRLLPNE